MFFLSDSPLDANTLRQGLVDGQAGGLVVFEGVVREANDGRTVRQLEYEGADALAANEFARIEAEAREQFDLLNLCCAHRVGLLGVGELAVWVGVTAAHRDAAFQGCRYLIDQVKERLPIWKKEYYAEGDSGWINSP